MELSAMQKQMLEGKRCPYCKAATVFSTGYMNNPVWICQPCQAWVGVHKGTNVALGRVAKAMLRGYKMQAHEAFDALWRNGTMNRKEAYAWLSEALQMPSEYTHIGMFGLETCKRVIELSINKMKG